MYKCYVDGKDKAYDALADSDNWEDMQDIEQYNTFNDKKNLAILDNTISELKQYKQLLEGIKSSIDHSRE